MVFGTLAASGYLSIEEFKLWNPHLDLSLYPDATLSGLIHKATREVDQYLGYTLPIETLSEKLEGTINGKGDLEIWVRKFPVESISSIKIVKGTTEVALEVESNGSKKYDIPSNSAPPALYSSSELGVVSLPLSEPFYLDITYRAGWEKVPLPIKEATALLVKKTMAERFNPGGFTRVSEGGMSLGTSILGEEARELLKPFKRVWG